MKKEKTALVIPNAVQVRHIEIVSMPISVICDMNLILIRAFTNLRILVLMKQLIGVRWNGQVLLHLHCCQGQNICDAI